MTPPFPVITIAFAIIAGVVGLVLYYAIHAPVWSCILPALPIMVFGSALDLDVQERKGNKE